MAVLALVVAVGNFCILQREVIVVRLNSQTLEQLMEKYYQLHDSWIEHVSIESTDNQGNYDAVVKLCPVPFPKLQIPKGTIITISFTNVREFRIWNHEHYHFSSILEASAEFIGDKIWFDFKGAMQTPDLKGTARADSELYFVAESVDWEESVEEEKS